MGRRRREADLEEVAPGKALVQREEARLRAAGGHWRRRVHDRRRRRRDDLGLLVVEQDLVRVRTWCGRDRRHVGGSGRGRRSGGCCGDCGRAQLVVVHVERNLVWVCRRRGCGRGSVEFVVIDHDLIRVGRRRRCDDVFRPGPGPSLTWRPCAGASMYHTRSIARVQVRGEPPRGPERLQEPAKWRRAERALRQASARGPAKCAQGNGSGPPFRCQHAGTFCARAARAGSLGARSLRASRARGRCPAGTAGADRGQRTCTHEAGAGENGRD
jgi:hypothetical protein